MEHILEKLILGINVKVHGDQVTQLIHFDAP
jgi:hypothetical protein